MLDLKLLREEPQEFEKRLKTKDASISLSSLLAMDQKIRELKAEGESLKAERNSLSKEIGLKKRQGEDASDIMAKVSGFGERISEIDHELKELEEKFHHDFGSLPNLPTKEAKVSDDPAENVCVKMVGEKKTFGFEPKNHVELNEKLEIFDFKRGAKIAGSGWPVYRGMGARLEWALLNYMIDIHIKNGFEFMMVPHLARPEIMFGSAHLPKFEDQLFKVKDEDFHLYLLPTSEAALNGLHFDEILEKESLPKKYVTYTPCFRREAGAAGAQERGLIRTHQFNKVEMFCLIEPEKSDEMLEAMLKSAEEVLEGLELHYRNMFLVTGDMSFASEKTIDIEVYLPGQERYYEVSSVSNCTDFQARRSKIRYKDSGMDKPNLVHTLNGSGLATSRLMVALIENHQREDGSVTLPRVLSEYLGGLQELRPK